MKKKIINGLLFAVAMVAATSSFVSCKDYEGDNYAEFQVKFATLQAAYDAQVKAMQNYVLTSRYDNETGYSAAVLAAYGKIHDRLVELEDSALYSSDLDQIRQTLKAMGISIAELEDSALYSSDLDGIRSKIQELEGISSVNSDSIDSLRNRLDRVYATLIQKNNQVIAMVEGLDSTYESRLRSLLIGWDNGGSLDDMISSASGLLRDLLADTANYNKATKEVLSNSSNWNDAYQKLQDSAKYWNSAYEDVKNNKSNWDLAFSTIAADSAAWNRAVEVADKAMEVADSAWNFVNKGNVTGRGQKFNTLQDMANAYDGAVDSLQTQIDDVKEDVAALNQHINNILAAIKKQVTGIEIQGTINPIYGTFAYPIGIQSNILSLYYGKFDLPVKFPVGDLDPEDYNTEWVGTPVILASELDDIEAPYQMWDATAIEKPIMNEAEDNAGKLYLTVNPSDVDFTGKEFSLRTSDNKVAKVTLSSLEPCTEQLKWGYQRRANSTNGFYVAKANISKDDVKDLVLSFDMGNLKTQIKDIYNNWRNTTVTDIANLGVTVLNGLQANTPRYGVQAMWKDTLGWKSYVSKYDIAAVSVKPLGYEFVYNKDFSGPVKKLRDKITGKEKAFSQKLIDRITKIVRVEMSYPESEGDLEVVYDEDGKATIYLVLTAGEKRDITALFVSIKDDVENAVKEIRDGANNMITDALNKIINYENKFFNKVIDLTKDPNRYLQPALIAQTSNGIFHPSRAHIAPTKVKKGTKLNLYPTTLTAEVITPAFKKYIAVSGVKVGGSWSVSAAKDINSKNTGFNKVFDGTQYDVATPMSYTVDAEVGSVIEIIYECLGYNGRVSGRKYYFEVVE